MFSSNRQLTTTPSALPESVAWLEHLTLEMTTSTSTRHGLGKRNVLYELHMAYQTSKDEVTTWTLSRPFDEYRDLRRRLVKALRLGHRCNAECKWLGNVIKHHFPGPRCSAGAAPAAWRAPAWLCCACSTRSRRRW